MAYFKCTNTVDRDEDPIYVNAENEADARVVIFDTIGSMPSSMLVFEKIDSLPDGEEAING